MRAKAGWGVAIIGVLIALLGIAMMLYLGPDGRKSSGPHPVETDGIAIVTAPKALSWVGLRIDVLAELPANKPVFVGLGNAVDVDDYIDKTARIEVDSFHTPWTVKTSKVSGESNLPAAPTSVDWWIASSAGLGGAGIDASLPSQTVRLAILSVGSSNLRGLNLTVAYGIKGGFAKGAGLALLGLGAVWLGLMLRRGDALWPEHYEVEEIEEVIYVYIDENGVEHEISAEEAEQYEIEDVSAGELDPETDDIPEPERGDEPEPAVASEPEAAKPVAPPVVYVYIDEDGVEHEVSEDELDDYEVVDEDEADGEGRS